MKPFIVDLNQFGKLCKECKKFAKKFKPWDESKVPGVSLISVAECKKCRMEYQIYKGMIWPIPFATHKEIKEMPKGIGRNE